MTKPRYRPGCPTAVLMYELKIGGAQKEEDRPGARWVRKTTGEILTLAEATREGHLYFVEEPGRRFLRDGYEPEKPKM